MPPPCWELEIQTPKRQLGPLLYGSIRLQYVNARGLLRDLVSSGLYPNAARLEIVKYKLSDYRCRSRKSRLSAVPTRHPIDAIKLVQMARLLSGCECESDIARGMTNEIQHFVFQLHRYHISWQCVDIPRNI